VEAIMFNAGDGTTRSGSFVGGAGAIAFGVSTLLALQLSNAPGGNYRPADVASFLARGHRVAVLVAMSLALLGVLGLVSFLAYLREAISAVPEKRRASDIIWGTGLAAATSFAIGWSVIGGQVIAHQEASFRGGSAISVPSGTTFLISELGIVLIFFSGAALLGFALIALMLSSRALFPTWLRWLILAAGIAGIAGLAWVTVFFLMLCMAIIGVWLVMAQAPLQRATTPDMSTSARS
jgi:hypothetical protein